MDSRRSGDGIDNPFLIRLRRLTRLGEGELAGLERACAASRQASAKADLVHEGDRPERLHILLEGWACRFKLLPDGRRQITALLLPGDICDLDSLYLGRSDYGVATLTACTVTTLDLEALRRLAAQQPAVSEALGFLIAVDNAMLTERSAGLGRRSAREHLAHFLCETLLRLTLVGRARGNGYTLLITQDEIGDVLGLTAVHVNRVIQSFRNDGVIERSGHNLIICEWNVLRQIGAFRPGYLHLNDADGHTVDLEQAPWALRMSRADGIALEAHG